MSSSIISSLYPEGSILYPQYPDNRLDGPYPFVAGDIPNHILYAEALRYGLLGCLQSKRSVALPEGAQKHFDLLCTHRTKCLGPTLAPDNIIRTQSLQSLVDQYKNDAIALLHPEAINTNPVVNQQSLYDLNKKDRDNFATLIPKEYQTAREIFGPNKAPCNQFPYVAKCPIPSASGDGVVIIREETDIQTLKAKDRWKKFGYIREAFVPGNNISISGYRTATGETGLVGETKQITSKEGAYEGNGFSLDQQSPLIHHPHLTNLFAHVFRVLEQKNYIGPFSLDIIHNPDEQRYTVIDPNIRPGGATTALLIKNILHKKYRTMNAGYVASFTTKTQKSVAEILDQIQNNNGLVTSIVNHPQGGYIGYMIAMGQTTNNAQTNHKHIITNLIQ